MKAFDFSLEDANGEIHHLHDYLGKKVVLYFYPKDSTPGCTQQACNYRDHMDAFQALNVVVIGISKDSKRAHKNFIEKQNLNFLLLSDPELLAIQAYDVWKQKKLYGREYMGVERTTFIIDEQGEIMQRFEQVSPKSDPQTILAALQNQVK